jgi:hypothetical protein
MASIGPLQEHRRFAEARPLLEPLLPLQQEHPEALYILCVLASEEDRWRTLGGGCAGLSWPTPAIPTPRPMYRWRWD